MHVVLIFEYLSAYLCVSVYERTYVCTSYMCFCIYVSLLFSSCSRNVKIKQQTSNGIYSLYARSEKCSSFGRKAWGERLIEISRYRWENNIKIIIWWTGWEVRGLDTFHSRHRPMVAYCKTAMELRVLWVDLSDLSSRGTAGWNYIFVYICVLLGWQKWLWIVVYWSYFVCVCKREMKQKDK
jgi:hypothetical protein